MVAGISSKDRRRITEGSPREGFGGHKRPPTRRKRTRELSRQNRDTQWKGWRGGREKRKSPPPRKKPPTKKEKPLLAAPLAYGRLRRPPLSLLFSLPSAAAPPPFLALSALLSPLVGGCAAPPLCFSSRASYGRLCRPTPSASLPLLLASSAAAPPLSPPRSRGRLAPPTLPLHYEIASLRDAHGDRYSSIPRLRKSEIFLSGVIEIEPLRGLFCCRHMS